MREAASPGDGALRRGIPAARTSLVGRERALATLREMILAPSVRLLTITGLGGSGKTRLAQALAADVLPSFDGNVCWIALAPVGDGALVPQAVAAGLGVIESPGTPVLDAVAGHLGESRCLLVLDNCEHLLNACAETAEHLLTACPELRILATSREPLMITGERQWRAPPLAVPRSEFRVPDSNGPGSEGEARDSELPEAVRLFVERAQAVAPDFRLTAANAGAVAEICIRLEGIPLAIELAAARARVLTAQQILAHLDDAFHLLVGGSRVAPTRQQTLRAALDWSHDLLSAEEQRFFRRLAVFAGGFDLEAADGLDLLTRLVDKSLVVVEGGGAVARYRLLEPVRQYARQHLDNQGEAGEAQAWHAAHFSALAERAAPALRGPDQVAWLERLTAEQDNLRAALRWAEVRDDAATIARIAVALTPFWEVRGGMSEGRRWLDAALDAIPAHPLPAALRLRALLAAGRLAQWQADLTSATARLDEAVAAARRLGDGQAIAESLTWLAQVNRRRGAAADAARLLDESLPLHEAVGDRSGAAFAVFIRGLLASDGGDRPRAIRLIEESLERYRDVGDVRFVGIAGTLLAAHMMHNEARRAAELLRKSLTGLRAVGDRAFMLSGLLTLAWVEAHSDRPAQAARLLGAAEALRNALGATLAPVNQETVDATLALIRPRLGEAERTAAEAAGRRMTLDEAIDSTMGRAGPPSRPAMIADASSDAVEPLTRREREVARLLARGAPDREIAATLSIAVSTAGVHVHNILGKLGLNSRWQAADWAIAHGLAPAPAD